VHDQWVQFLKVGEANRIATRTGVNIRDLISAPKEEHDDLPTKDSPFDQYLLDHVVEPEGPALHGTSEEQRMYREVVLQFQTQFSTRVHKEPARVPPFTLKYDKEKWGAIHKAPARLQSSVRQRAIDKFVSRALDDGVIAASQAAAYSQLLLVPKPTEPGSEKKWRVCVDYRLLNTMSGSNGWPIPRIDQIIQRIGNCKPQYFAVLDLTSGYHQVPVAAESQEATAFITAGGVYTWRRIPIGLKGAPSYFQAQMANTVLKEHIRVILEIYLDNIIIFAQLKD